jgi:phage host-nuclease inhibitor protein Gam
MEEIKLKISKKEQNLKDELELAKIQKEIEKHEDKLKEQINTITAGYEEILKPLKEKFNELFKKRYGFEQHSVINYQSLVAIMNNAIKKGEVEL